MNRYLLCDDNDANYNKLVDYKDLRELLIDEVERDTFNCYDDRDIVMNNFKIMRELTKNEYNYQFIKKELECFGWYVMDLTQLQRDLSNFQAYKHGTGSPCIPHDCIYETLELIDKEMRG